MLTERITCILPLTVRTGFQTSEITLLEGTSGEICLSTEGELCSDALIDITLVDSEGSAGSGAPGEDSCVTCL